MTNQPFPTQSFLHLDVMDKYSENNIEEAQKLLKESGYAQGLFLEVVHPQGIYPGLWELIDDQLSAIGITLKLSMTDIPQYLERSISYDYNLSANEQSAIYHWDRALGYFESSSTSNWLVGGYHKDDIASMLFQARNESDLVMAKKLYTKILFDLQSDTAVLFIVSLPTIQAWSTDLSMFSPNPINGTIIWPGGGLNYDEISSKKTNP